MADAFRTPDERSERLTGFPFEVGERFAAVVNAPAPRKVEHASHFLQEDAGEEIGRSIADWLAAAG